MAKFSETLDQLISRKNLTEAQAKSVMGDILSGSVPPAQIAAFLTALRTKGETADEVTGFAKAMRDSMTKVDAGTAVVVDTCGTGGDSKGTFNISTAAAFVVAGAGFTVAKHGNRSVSSACGSADVLEALGVKIDLPKDKAEKILKEVGIVFLFAPAYHPAMKNVGPVRKELGVRTVFNILGPLANPASATAQVIGVSGKELLSLLAGVLRNLNRGSKNISILVHENGHDEIILSGKGTAVQISGSKLKTMKITPKSLGLKSGKISSLTGGNAVLNAQILRSVLEGKNPDLAEIVIANASLAIYAAEKIKSDKAALKDAVLKAAASLKSGEALKKLNLLIERSAQ